MTSSIRMEDNQIQILDQCQNFFVVVIANEHIDFFKSEVSFFGLEGFQLEFISDEPIGYVDVVLHVFGCGVGLKKVAHADVETGEVLCLQQLIFRCSN